MRRADCITTGRGITAPWLGRWVSCDPEDLIDGPDTYSYVRGNPVAFVDVHGNAASCSKPSTANAADAASTYTKSNCIATRDPTGQRALHKALARQRLEHWQPMRERLDLLVQERVRLL